MEQLLLVTKVHVKAASGNPRCPDHPIDRRLSIGHTGKLLLSGQQQPLPLLRGQVEEGLAGHSRPASSHDKLSHSIVPLHFSVNRPPLGFKKCSQSFSAVRLQRTDIPSPRPSLCQRPHMLFFFTISENL